MRKFFVLPVFAILFSFSLAASAAEVGDNFTTPITLKVVNSVAEQVEESILEPTLQTQEFVILDFMSIYCGYCVENLPTIKWLATNAASKATVRSIVIDRGVEQVKEFFVDDSVSVGEAGANRYGFSAMFDNERKATRAFGIRATPTLYVVDKSGEVVYKHEGLLRPIDVEEILVVLGLE